MKKALSLFLALLMGLSVFTAAIPAFAFDYSYYSFCRGKKNGEILGFFDYQIQTAQSNEGFDAVTKIVMQSRDKYVSAIDKMNKAYTALVETDKDITAINALKSETGGGMGGVHESFFGLAASMGDPSGAARDTDIILAEYSAAKKDLSSANTTGNRAKAESAFYGYADLEETIIDLYEAVGGASARKTMDMLCDEIYDFYQRRSEVSKKTHTDIAQNNAMLDAALADAGDSATLLEQAVAKARELAQTATGENKTKYEEYASRLEGVIDEYRSDIHIGECERASYDMTEFDDVTDALGMCSLKSDFRKYFSDNLISRYFVSATPFTADGKTGKALIRLGSDLGETDTSKIIYALGNAHPTMAEGAEYVTFANNEGPAAEDYSAAIPTAKTAGTYYVYCKFPRTGSESGTVNICVKVKVAQAPKPAPVVKKKNPLTAKGKTVKLKASKLKKNKLTVKRATAITVKNAKGTVTYKIAKKNKNFTVSKAGKITVKKGVKKGTYKVKIKVTAAGNATYKAKTQTVTVKIIVK